MPISPAIEKVLDYLSEIRNVRVALGWMSANSEFFDGAAQFRTVLREVSDE